MKRILIALCAIYPLFAHADIIATFNNGNIEDVTVVSIGADEVLYNEGGTQKSIVSSQVEGILYDDGRYVTPPKKAAVTESVESSSDNSWAVEDASISQKLTNVDRDGYLICAADNKSYTGWDDLVLLDLVVKTHEKKKNEVKEGLEHIYYLCIMKEDFNAYNTYLKGYKDIKKMYQKASKEHSYNLAQPASRAYKAKKDEGASSEEAIATFINTYIEVYNQSKINK